MAKWWKLGLGGKKDKEQSPPPETPPTPAAPTPAPAPPPQEPPAEEKKRGFFGRLADKVTGKAKKEKAAKPEAEAPPEAPPEAPAETRPAPPSGGEGGEAEAEGEAEGGGAGPGEPEERRTFPSSISVSAYGDWVISANEWYGEMSGTLTGSEVKEFILAHEHGNWTRCAELIAGVWDSPAADLVDVYASNIEAVTWS
ncbi:hypothetical protein ACFT25_38040 [Streptomyces hydrogenans]|uniref:hypothetical protein n=1 Tax=Streptomyces hydrogenans TaxID=1873719 RepID=UPI0036311F24